MTVTGKQVVAGLALVGTLGAAVAGLRTLETMAPWAPKHVVCMYGKVTLQMRKAQIRRNKEIAEDQGQQRWLASLMANEEENERNQLLHDQWCLP